ncbi:DUF6049 family protein [Actinacidiphila acidipaludis]|uniref:DUF6049 family protein n=1 Tax=Actinacidiphila acidipaludis TaxID=2873382 RepID=A0ABS7Q7J1_9ACTN|nr:DUF6049 family protein [Streptomyces acidipaludis]MBY8879125.1 DUF6049 family protein [Streptomyces acidipaludis]
MTTRDGERVGDAAQAPRTAPPARRRRWLRATAAIAGATLLTGLLQGLQATGSEADSLNGSQAKAPSGSRTAVLSIDTLDPRVPTKDGSVTVSGTITNDGKSTITDAKVELRTGPGGPLHTRSDMTSAADRAGFTTQADGEVDGDPVGLPDIPAGSTVPYTIKVPVSALSLGDTGVYQLGVTLEGQNSALAWPHVLGIKRTFLPWYADGEAAKATEMTYLWPLTDRPHIAARGDTDTAQSPIFLDDDLTQELAPGGRLDQMVQLGKQLPVTWVINPDLLATVEAMLKSYRVAGPGGDVAHTTPGTGSAVARQWLNSVKAAVAGAQVVALPFGDTDLASLAHHGTSGTISHVKDAALLGRSTVNTILGVQASANVAWPVQGAVDSSIVSVARSGGMNRIIASNATFPENDLAYTPTAARSLGGGMTGLVSDASLSNAFTGDMLHEQNANLAVQSFLSQTLLITMQAPENQRSLVVAPQRMPTVSQAQAMAEAISTTESSPWTQSVDLNAAATAHPDSHVSHRVPPTSAYPASLRKQELSTNAFEQIQETQRNLNDFVVILTVKDRVTVPFGNAVLRSMSTEWRGDSGGAADFRDAIGGYLQDLINAVHILDKTTLTLSGRSGTIPVTVKNDLGQPITGLVLRLTSGTNIRLEIRNPEQPITIDGGHTRTLKFQTKANANGTVRITAHLYTKNGTQYGLYGGTVRFDVNVTKVTDLVMLIIAAGLLLLVLAGVRIYRQRKRQAADDGGDDGSGGDGTSDGSSGDGGDGGQAESKDTGQPGDPAADTGLDSQERSPAGEKVDG